MDHEAMDQESLRRHHLDDFADSYLSGRPLDERIANRRHAAARLADPAHSSSAAALRYMHAGEGRDAEIAKALSALVADGSGAGLPRRI